MAPETLAPSSKHGVGWLCLGYAVVMLYSSTVIGPIGINFVFRDPVEAFHQLLATHFVAHGSDQRADWIGNLLMLVPFGFLAAATVWPRRPAFRLPAAIAALLICAATIVTIKYLQLFFPPRTVTLNYIVAQGLGATAGCLGFAVWHQRMRQLASRRDPVAPFVLALRLYAGALLVFLLMPLDFALNSPDLWAQIERLPDTVLALPGDGRPLTVRVMEIAAATAAFVPVGMLLAFVWKGVYQVRRGLLAVTTLGLVVTTGVFALSALVMGAAPIMASILYRTVGIMIGAAMLRWLTQQDSTRLRYILRGWVPWMLPPYFLALLLVNRLLSLHWLSPADAIDRAYPLGLLPLFDYYIVSKAAAAKNIIAHVALYMPIGIGLWLRDGVQRPGRAFALAASISFAVELGRYLRPGLEGDINAVVVAGLAAMLAMRLMPVIWSMLTNLARHSRPAPERRWHTREARVAGGEVPQPLGEIEEF